MRRFTASFGDSGALAFLDKPLHIDILLDKIRSIPIPPCRKLSFVSFGPAPKYKAAGTNTHFQDLDIATLLPVQQ